MARLTPITKRKSAMSFRQRPLIFFVLIAALSWLWLGVQSAAAHAVPTASRPAANETLPTSPETLEISFSEPIVPAFSSIQVLSAAGQILETGPLTPISDDNTRVQITLPPLNNGSYIASWKVLSAVDGHSTSGIFPFSVGVGHMGMSDITPGQVVTTAPRPTPASLAARWFNLAGAALLLGLFTFRLLLWNPILNVDDLTDAEIELDHRFARRSLHLGIVAAGLLLLAAGITLVSQSSQYDLLAAGNLGVWLNTRFGLMWLLRLLAALALAALLWRLLVSVHRAPALRGGKWWLGLLLSLVVAATIALVSHSAALQRDAGVAIAIDFAHVTAAGIWVGGLILLGVSLWQARRLPADIKAWLYLSAILNFSVLAAAAVGVILASGAYLSYRHVGSWGALVSTAYGRILLLKIGLALVPFLIAATNLFWVKPRLRRTYDQPEAPAALAIRRRFRTLVTVETVFAVLILVAAGLLTDMQRAQDAPLLSAGSTQTVLTQQVDDLNVSLTLEPALVGENNFNVYLQDESGLPVADAREVLLRFTFLGQSLGAAEAIAENAGDGHYHLTNSTISLLGPWQIEVAIRRTGQFDVFAPFRLEAGLDGRIAAQGPGGGAVDNLVSFLTRARGLVPGVALVLFALVWGVLANKAADKDWQLAGLLSLSLLSFYIGAQQLFQFSQDYTPAMFASNPITPDADSIAQGRVLYEANCLSCHGEQGNGDGPAAASLPAPPANFNGGHTATHPDGDLWYWIKAGIEGTNMPAFESQLSDDDIWHLVNYVRRLSASPPSQTSNAP